MNTKNKTTTAPTLTILRTTNLRELRGEWFADDQASVMAYDQGGHWNGWALPLVTREELVKLCAAEAVVAQTEADNEGCIVQIGDKFFWRNDGEFRPANEELEPTHQLKDGTPLYAIGLGFTWSWV